MIRSALRSKSGRRPGFRGFAVLCLLGATAYFWSSGKGPAARDSEPPPVAREQRSTVRQNEAKPSLQPETLAPSAAVPVSTASPQPGVQAGHEGHGDECAQCLAERKLATYREDYARIHYDRAMEERHADEREALEVLDACRVLAGKVLREWSFSESRPVLPPDEVVDARQREILDPLLSRLPLKEESDR